MEINVKIIYGSVYIVIKDDNVHIEEDISKTIWGLKEDGKTDFGKRLGKDIEDSAINMFTSVIEDIYDNRQSKFDCSNAIKLMFEKLPDAKVKELLTELCREYDDT